LKKNIINKIILLIIIIKKEINKNSVFKKYSLNHGINHWYEFKVKSKSVNLALNGVSLAND